MRQSSEIKWTKWFAAMSICVALIAIVSQLQKSPIEPAKKAQGLSNIKQFGAALEVYISENGGKFPPNMTSPRFGLPDIKQSATGYPIWNSMNPGHEEFLGNSSLGGKAFSVIKDPGHTLVFFDSAPWPDGKRGILLADGQAHRISEKQFQDAIANQWVVKLEH